MACSSPCPPTDDMMLRYSPEDWENLVQEMSKFNFAFATNQSSPAISSPPSATFSSGSSSSGGSNSSTGIMTSAADSLSSHFTWDTPQACLSSPPSSQSQHSSHHSVDITTPLATPSFESGWPMDVNHAVDPSLYTPTQEAHRPDWPATPKSSPFPGGFDGHVPFIADLDSPPPSMRWAAASATTMAQPSPTSPTFHERFNHENLSMHMSNDMGYKASGTCTPGMTTTIDPGATGGLMIQIPQSPIPQACVIPAPSMPHHRSTGALNAAYQRQRQPSEHLPRHPGSVDRPRQASMAASSHGRRKQSRVTSSSLSPTKSFNHISKRHVSMSAAAHQRAVDMTPRTPKVPNMPMLGGGGGGGVDFVNYTPSDSMRILTGVAPSGSSKTKARREKEAMEKRRKLSQAALRAVKDAGGDVARLLQDGLFS